MRLIEILKLIPLRNERGEVYKWQEEANLLSPLQVTRVKHEPNLDHVVVRLQNGEEIVIEDTLKEFGRKFNEATT